MAPTPRTAPPLDAAVTCDDASFRRIAAILHAETGINLPRDNSSLVVARLVKHLRRLRLDDFAELVDWIEVPEHADDRAQVISALTTNTTHFYREGYHFDVFVRELLPRLKQEAKAGSRVRLWSAGCSSGEEVYSLAATLLHHWPEAPRADLRILATDICADVLHSAEAAIYPRDRLDAVPGPIRDLMLSETPAGEDMVRMPEALRALVSVRYLNFVQPWPTRGPFQAIMCRNVAIYMDEDTQTRVFTGLADQLAPQGLLFIGHSERLPANLAHRLTLIDRTTFRHA